MTAAWITCVAADRSENIQVPGLSAKLLIRDLFRLSLRVFENKIGEIIAQPR